MYPASESFPPLRKDWSVRAGIISTVHVGSRTGWWSFPTVKAGVRWQSAMEQNLVEI